MGLKLIPKEHYYFYAPTYILMEFYRKSAFSAGEAAGWNFADYPTFDFFFIFVGKELMSSYRDFCPGSLLEGRAEISVIFG